MNSSIPVQGPSVLLHHLPDFATHLKSEGYTAETIRVYLICLQVLDRKAAALGMDLNQLAERHANRLPLIPGELCPSNGLGALLAYLAKRKLLVPTGLQAEIDHFLGRYKRFLLTDRGLAAGTANMHGRIARRFLSFCFKEGRLRPELISVHQVRAFLSQPDHHLKHISLGMKALLRYLFMIGAIKQPVAEGLTHTKTKSKSRLPRSMSPEQLEDFLAGLPMSTPTERRNRAMILLLARLGLRIGEVFRLMLDDVDWNDGTLLVRGKGEYFDRMPMPEDAGRALFNYIAQDRPQTASSKAVFVKERAPHDEISRTSLPLNLRKLLAASGVTTTSRTGSRIFRHSFATHMVARGAPIADVANAMRHRQLNTTMVYARTDLAGLMAVARPWPTIRRRAHP